jgi:transglutaminase-like putative cysteine protease
MRFSIFHRTRYVYRAPVRDSHNEVRLRPVTDDKSRLEFFLLKVHPPVRLRHFRDTWLNYVHYFDIADPHSGLSIESQSRINTTSPYGAERPVGVALGVLKALSDETLPSFLGNSRYIAVSPEVWRLGIDIRDGREDVFETAEAVMHHVYREWTYAPNTTTASTHMSEVFAARRGVCQDFTHVMIGICRSLGIPARYVSGYLYNGQDAQLRGAQASHAWCEVYVPGKGWFGLDPTNDTLADERHIKIATGRDYADAAPISGNFDGPPGATTALQVDLEVRRADG